MSCTRLINTSLGEVSSGRELRMACVDMEAFRPILARSARSCLCDAVEKTGLV